MALKSMRFAADTWGVSVCTARRLAAAGIVHTVRVGRRRLIAETEIARIEATGVLRVAQPEAASAGSGHSQRALRVKADGSRPTQKASEVK
jgi:hypothetical protein